MDDGKHDDLIGHRVEIDRVGEASYEHAAYLALDARACERCLQDAGKCPVDLSGEGPAKPGTLILVPVTGVQ
jgi:hypothetical protein